MKLAAGSSAPPAKMMLEPAAAKSEASLVDVSFMPEVHAFPSPDVAATARFITAGENVRTLTDMT